MSLFRKAMPVIRTGAIVLSLGVTVIIANPVLDKLILPVKMQDKPEDKKRLLEQSTFDPNQTDVMGYELGFVKPHVEQLEVEAGKFYILSQSFPKWFTYVLAIYTGDAAKKAAIESQYETKSVDILDARKRQGSLKVDETGFTLLQMKQPTKTTHWRSAKDIQQHFHEELRPYLMKLYPGATRIEFTHHVVRGGNHFGDQPAAVDGPHLDYSQNDKARAAFHETYPINEMVKEQMALMGKLDTPDEEVRSLIGIWKPIHMSNQPVYDHPLAVMDASSYKQDHERPYHLHMDFIGFVLHNLNGAFTYDTNQKWYYYPYQKESEVLVFTHYSKGKHFANPHTSFLVPNRPKEYKTRQSIEMRAAVFYPRDTRDDSMQDKW